MNNIQTTSGLYKELCALIASKVPAIRWQDIWHNQVNFLSREHQFPTPAMFYAFRIISTKDKGLKTQEVKMQVSTYIFYETMADTYNGSFNQTSALSFLDIIDDAHGVLHGSEGTQYSSMRRTGLSDVESGDAGNLYIQTFECTMTDYGAMTRSETVDVEDVSIEAGEAPAPEEPGNDFIVNT